MTANSDMANLLRTSSIAALISLIFVGCSPSGSSSDAQPSTSVTQASISPEGFLSLSKANLGEEWLLHTSLVLDGYPMLGTPSAQSFDSRAVFFKQKNGSLFLMESNAGLHTSDEFDSERILTEFKIAQENPDAIIFDFNEGMKNLFIGGGAYDPSIAIPVNVSYLKNVESTRNEIVLRQAVQLKASAFGETILPAEIVYYLEPYQSGGAFVGKPQPRIRKVGYFETLPHIIPELGNPETWITRWDHDHPIVYHISANTPEKYRAAVREGILYWNKVFGTEVVKAEIAPEGITAPHPNYNIIQWVTNHNAGLAYADFQTDPNNGKIKHAQVYLPSTFIFHSEIALENEQQVEKKGDTIELQGFKSQVLCKYPLNFSEEWLALENATDDEENPISSKLAQDFLRTITAHEVGHTLGLRHNFAASTNATIAPQEKNKVFTNYLHNGLLKEPVRTASSVMDYLTGEDAILLGQYIGQKETPALPYDSKAVAWGYYDAPVTNISTDSVYCSDEIARGFRSKYIDCQLFDPAGHPVRTTAYSFERNILKLPQRLASILLLSKTHPDALRRRNVEELIFSAQGAARELTSPLGDFLHLLQSKSHSLLVESLFPVITDVNKGAVQRATVEWINAGIQEGEGIQKILSTIDQPQNFYKTLTQYSHTLKKILEQKHFEKVSQDEKNIFFKNSVLFFDRLRGTLMTQITQLLSGMPETPIYRIMEETPDEEKSAESQIYPSPFPEPSTYLVIKDLKSLETALGNWASFLILEGADEKPLFDGDLRILATSILTPYLTPVKYWQQENRAEVLRMLMEKLKKRFGQPFGSVDPAKLSAEDRAAFDIEKRIVYNLFYADNPYPSPECGREGLCAGAQNPPIQN